MTKFNVCRRGRFDIKSPCEYFVRTNNFGYTWLRRPVNDTDPCSIDAFDREAAEALAIALNMVDQCWEYSYERQGVEMLDNVVQKANESGVYRSDYVYGIVPVHEMIVIEDF